MSRRDALMAFLERWKDRPVEWGVSDCSAWPALWVEEITGRKLALPAYDTREDAYRLMDEAGGLVALWRAALADTGAMEFAAVEAVELGDVGVMDTRGFGPVGVIFAAPHLAYWKAETGILPIQPRHLLAAWHVQ